MALPYVEATIDWTAGSRPPDAPRTHRTSIRGLVTDADGRLLLVRTADGHVMLPGGGLEDGEDEEGCLRREILEETGVVLAAVGEAVGTSTELNPDRDGVSTWALECRYLHATASGETVPATPSGYEVDLGLHPVWVAPAEAIALLSAQLGVPGRPGCWAVRELPIVAGWLSRR